MLFVWAEVSAGPVQAGQSGHMGRCQLGLEGSTAVVQSKISWHELAAATRLPNAWGKEGLGTAMEYGNEGVTDKGWGFGYGC